MPAIDLAAIRSFENLELLARQLVDGFITGLHQSPYHGFSVEFSEHRLYNPGDSTRHVDWKVFARTDRLFVKRYEEETNLRAHLLLDVSPSMYYPAPGHDKLKFSILAAAALTTLLAAPARCRGPRHLRRNRGAANARALHHLGPPPHACYWPCSSCWSGPPRRRPAAAPGPTPMWPACCTPSRSKFPKRSLVIVFSDMLGRGRGRAGSRAGRLAAPAPPAPRGAGVSRAGPRHGK